MPKLGWIKTDMLTGMLGVTYNGFAQTILSLEMAQGFPLSAHNGVLFPLGLAHVSVRASRSFLRERLQTSLAANMFGWDAAYGWLARAELSYALRDALKVSVAYITYQPGTSLGPIAGFTQHDRLMTKIRWDF
jgi:hypothetical protein